MSERWPGGIISQTAPVPSGPYEDSTAPGIWTMEQAAYWQSQGNWPIVGNPAIDPYFEYVSLLLPGNGTNGGQNNTFLDSSTNNFTITRNGNTTQGSFSPYGNLWGNYFPSGSSGGSTSNEPLSFSTITLSGDFTVEGWVFLEQNNAFGNVLVGSTLSVINRQFAVETTTGNPRLAFYDGTAAYFSTGTIPRNTWTHYAYVRSGSTIAFYINGVASGSAASSASFPLTTIAGLGGYGGGIRGYMSNLRITTSAVYTSSFIPSTTPLTAISNTQLLTCQSNRFRDNSTNNLTLTVSGTPSVQRFSPFSPATSYTPATIGGSGYFDGTTDYLSSTSVPVNFGTGAYTIEGWFYCTNIAVSSGIFSSVPLAGVYGVALYISSDGRFVYYEGNSSDGASVNFYTTMANYQNQWVYFACVDTGSTRSLYLNGVQVTSDSTGRSLSSQTFVVGGSYSDDSSSTFPGYITNVRVSNIARYTGSTMSVPTAQLTADANTIYFAKMENASIFDYAMMNNLETAGNAQISTTQSKFGGSSISFDGTGDYLSLATRPMLDFKLDFTIEGWFYQTGQASFQGIFSNGDYPASSQVAFTIYDGAPSLYISDGTGWVIGMTAPSAISINTWTHIAATCSGSTFTIWVNGASAVTATYSGTRATPLANSVIGRLYVNTNGFYFLGYMNDLRITNGYARYTAPFTPPTGPFLTR